MNYMSPPPSSVCWLYPRPAARCGAGPLSVWLQHHPAAYTGEGSAPQTPAQPLPTLPESNRRIHTPQKEPGEGRRGGGGKKTEEKGGVRRAEIKEREFMSEVKLDLEFILNTVRIHFK